MSELDDLIEEMKTLDAQNTTPSPEEVLNFLIRLAEVIRDKEKRP